MIVVWRQVTDRSHIERVADKLKQPIGKSKPGVNQNTEVLPILQLSECDFNDDVFEDDADDDISGDDGQKDPTEVKKFVRGQ